MVNSPQLKEMIQFDQYFPTDLKPPTRHIKPALLGDLSPSQKGGERLLLCAIPCASSSRSVEITRMVRSPGMGTWRIIPFSKWLITTVSKSPKWGYSPYKWPKWLINRGY